MAQYHLCQSAQLANLHDMYVVDHPNY